MSQGGVRIMQADDPQRAISFQNPMSINDLMVTQDGPRRLSTGAVGRHLQSRRFNLPARRPRRNIPLPPSHQPPPSSRSNRPPEPSPGGGGGGGDGEPAVNAADMGYDLILNERKAKREEHSAGSSNNPGGGDEDELWPQNTSTGPRDDFVDPHERERFEREQGFDDGRGPGPQLPPTAGKFPSPHRPASTPRRLSVRRETSPDFGGSGLGASGFVPPGGAGAPPPPFYNAKPFDYEEQLEKKRKFLEGLDKFRRRGMNVKHFDIDAPFEEIETEYNRHKRAVDVEGSIQFSRKMLMACVTGLEYLNSRYDPLGLQLDGWSESVIEDIHNYDDVFERLYDKYHTSVEMAPEFELLLMVAGSAFMYHLTNSMFTSAMPGMANPEMMRNVRRGVMGAMSGALSGAAGGGGVSGMMNGMFGGSGANNPPKGPPKGPPPGRPQASRGGGRVAPRREMRGPSQNMDDLLNNLMDREPGEVSNRLVEEIDDILNNPSDDDDARPASSIRITPVAGPGGSPAISNDPPIPMDI